MKHPQTFHRVCLFLSLLLTDCGGEVHFTLDRDLSEPLKTIPSDRTVTDIFHFAQATGTSVVILTLAPRKSITRFKDHLTELVPQLSQNLIQQSPEIQDTRIAFHRDTTGPLPSWHQPSALRLPKRQWATSISEFLNQELSTSAVEPESHEFETTTPFDNMILLAQSLSTELKQDSYPLWVHWIYMRDWDLLPAAGLHQTLHQTLYDQKEQLLQTLSQGALSRFRYSYHVISHTQNTAGCLPPSRLSPELTQSHTNMPGTQNEICDLVTGQGPALIESINQSIAEMQAQMILKKAPDASTLVVLVKGQKIPREQVLLDAATNRLQLTAQATRGVHSGDEIQVQYVPQ